MLNKEQSKEKLKNLVADFKNNPSYYKKLSEADIRHIQKLLGHANVQTTQMYTHVANKDIKQLAQLL